MTQAASWTRKEGEPSYPGLVGQIFFPTDSDRLDGRDSAVLERLAHDYQILLLGHRIELTCVGHADMRGGTDYNRGLGQRRAETVQSFFKRRLGNHLFFSCQRAISRGEMDAAQRHPSQARMAEDRRVDVFSSFIPRRRVVLPPLRITAAPPADRCVFRLYTSSTTLSGSTRDIMEGGMDNAAFDHLLNALMNMASSLGPDGSLGSELQNRRRFAFHPPSHRVNRIRIETEELYSPPRWGGPSTLESTSEVYYEWGAPADRIEVIVKKHYRDGLTERSHRSTESRRVERGSVAGNPFFFPPDRAR